MPVIRKLALLFKMNLKNNSELGTVDEFLSALSKLEAEGNRREQHRLVYDQIEDALEAKNFYFVNEVLSRFDPWRINVPVLLSLLIATLDCKKELVERTSFFFKVQQRLLDDPTYRSRADRLLGGLELNLLYFKVFRGYSYPFIV